MQTLADIFLDKSGAITSWNPSDFASSVSTATVGADESQLSWTYAAMKGAF